MSQPEEALDRKVANVDDHPFTPAAERMWGPCLVCGLAQASHAHVPPENRYVATTPRAKTEEPK